MNIALATIQLENPLGNTVRSFYEAELLIRQAHKKGAKFVFLPELSSCGYIPNQNIWQYAEPLYGPTIKWATTLAQELNIYIGAGFCECDGKDFFNAYFITNSDGQIDGVVRQFETDSYLFKAKTNNIFIKTKLANIAIGLGLDSHYKWFYQNLQKEHFDFLILPYNKALNNNFDPFLYYNNFSVPVIYLNMLGKFPQKQGLLAFLYKDKLLKGESIIITNKSDEYYYNELNFKTINNVALMPAPVKIKSYHGLVYPQHFFCQNILTTLDKRLGEKFYKRNKKRKHIASFFKKMIDNKQLKDEQGK